jgi:hypothetical protein
MNTSSSGKRVEKLTWGHDPDKNPKKQAPPPPFGPCLGLWDASNQVEKSLQGNQPNRLEKRPPTKRSLLSRKRTFPPLATKLFDRKLNRSLLRDSLPPLDPVSKPATQSCRILPFRQRVSNNQNLHPPHLTLYVFQLVIQVRFRSSFV